MENNTLIITVRNKVASAAFGDYLVSENSDYLVRFDFDSEWNAYAAKTVHFSIGGWEYEATALNDTASVPLLPSGISEIHIGAVAGSLSTTTAAVVPVYDSVLANSQPTSITDAAEIARARAEAERVQAEQGRAAAENARVAAENARVAAENARVQAENARTSSEAGRVAAETARQQAETNREQSETLRQSAEQSRIQHENTRIAAEETRVLSEDARTAAENLRRNAETSRVSAENARVSSEASRALAEELRAQAETARRDNETARQLAEHTRAENESERVAAEAARVLAEEERESRMNAFTSALNAYAQANDAFNVPYLLSEYGMKTAFSMFVNANAPLAGLTSAVDRFFTAAAPTVNSVYSVTFPRHDVSTASTGVKKDANSGLVCTPSVTGTAGRDDYADLPLFCCFDCNYTIDAVSLEPVIHAVKDVYGSFSSAPSDSFVGVLQMTGWVKRTADTSEKNVSYAAVKKDSSYKPLPEAVRAGDNGVRSYVIHAKYAAGINSAGKLSSISGVQVASKRTGSGYNTVLSHDSGVSLWREWGQQYAGSSIADVAFLQLMLEIKYASLASAPIMAGCRNYDFAFPAAATETGVKRILLTSANAANLVAGSSVSIGTSSDRANAGCYDIADVTVITSIEPVTVGGETLAAVNIESDGLISCTKGECYIVTHPWRTGATDGVSGNDGSPTDNTSGKEPFKLQGIEIMLGAGEVVADTTAHSASGLYNIYMTRRAEDIRTGTYGGVNPASLGTITKTGSAGSRYIAELSWNDNSQEKYLLPAQFGASAGTGYRAAQYHVHANTSSGSYSAWVAFGNLRSEEVAGVCAALLSTKFTDSSPYLTARACGTAGSRGNYDANASL